MLGARTSLNDLRADFLSTSTQSMPLAGIAFWAVVAVAGLTLSSQQVAYLVGFGSGAIFPLALLIDKARGRTIVRANTGNPLVGMFLQSLVVVGLLWPMVIIGAVLGREPGFVVLGGAILMAIVWIPYGWAADDRAGMQHAVARCVLGYAAFLLTPKPFTSTAIAGVVLLCYGFSLIRMRRAPSAGGASDHVTRPAI